MADNMDKEAKKEAKQAEKEALKAKKERIKASKPKKDGNVFTRAGKGIARYFKDFKGTTKKIIWPPRKTVFKNSGIVLVSIIVAGLAVYGVDQLLTVVFDWGKDLASQAGEMFTEPETSTSAAGLTTVAVTDGETKVTFDTTAPVAETGVTGQQTTAAGEVATSAEKATTAAQTAVETTAE